MVTLYLLPYSDEIRYSFDRNILDFINYFVPVFATTAGSVKAHDGNKSCNLNLIIQQFIKLILLIMALGMTKVKT